MKHSWALEWALQRPLQIVRFLPEPGALVLIDSRFVEPELLAFASQSAVTAYGPSGSCAPALSQNRSAPTASRVVSQSRGSGTSSMPTTRSSEPSRIRS